MPTSRRGEVEIYYEVAGAGPPLVLLHAIPFDHTLWLYQLAHLSTWFRVVALDLRGFGRSSKVAAPFSFEDLENDVLGVMADADMSKAVIMGCSAGSKIALSLGANYPDKITAVIQVGGNSGPQDFEGRISGYTSQEFGPYRRGHLRHGNRPGFGDEPIGKYLHDMFSERDGWNDAASTAAFLSALAAADVRPYLAGYSLPTLIINGEFDSALAAWQKDRERDARRRAPRACGCRPRLYA